MRTTYAADDAYKLFESRAHRINIHLLNNGSQYIEDASIQLKIERCFGLIIAEEIPEEPQKGADWGQVRFPTLLNAGYPKVEQSTEGYSLFQEIGDIRHCLTTPAFEEPLRVVLSEQAKGKTIKVQCTILGKNLAAPRTEDLSIEVI